MTNEGAGGEKPVISWLAVADQTLPGAPQNATAALRGRHVHHGLVGCLGPHRPGIHRATASTRPAAPSRCARRADTTCTVKDLELGTTHAYEVAGVNELGEGERSAATASVTLPEVPSNDGAKAAPGKGVLSSNDGWDTGLKDGTFQVAMNLWWGENGSLFKLYQDGELVAKVPLTMMTPGAQRAAVDITGLANGTYVFTGELVNSKGTTATQSLTVKVTDAAPGKPVLSADNSDGDGTYTVTADLWWGTNATSYRFLENGVEVGSGSLTRGESGGAAREARGVGQAEGLVRLRRGVHERRRHHDVEGADRQGHEIAADAAGARSSHTSGSTGHREGGLPAR